MTMFTKIALLTAAAAILLSTASATFTSPKVERFSEPLYFQYATGEQG
jgi:hypothetical protein